MRWTLLCLTLLAAAPAARADNRDVAREEFKTGARYFEIADYPHALEHFKAAYVQFEDPAILFNIAQCERLLNHKQEALRAYRIYLQKKPDSPNRADIENIIATLQDAINKDQKASTMPPVGVEGQKAAPEEAPAPTPPPPATTTAPAPAPAPVVASTPPPPEKPIYKKWWLWAAAGAVVVVAVAVGVGVGVAESSHPDFKPTGPDIGPGATSAALIAGYF